MKRSKFSENKIISILKEQEQGRIAGNPFKDIEEPLVRLQERPSFKGMFDRLTYLALMKHRTLLVTESFAEFIEDRSGTLLS